MSNRNTEASNTESCQQNLQEAKDREKEIILASFGLDGREETSIEDIADSLDLSQERVRQIRDRALRKLRKAYNRRVLKDYMSE